MSNANPTPSSSSQTTPRQPAANNSPQVHPFLLKSPLIKEPLGRKHKNYDRLSAMRAAILAGEDVNQQDTEPHVGYNEGRPLDACLNLSHMPANADLLDSLPLIELLLDHGADPRLCVWIGSVIRPPIRVAQVAAEDVTDPEMKAFWKHVVQLFEEAIAKLEAKGVGIEEARRKTLEGREEMRRMLEEKFGKDVIRLERRA